MTNATFVIIDATKAINLITYIYDQECDNFMKSKSVSFHTIKSCHIITYLVLIKYAPSVDR